MTTTIGINGFGRIGRNILRALFESGRTDIRVAGINDLAPIEMQAHLFEFDSVHGTFNGEVDCGSDWIRVNGATIPCSSEQNPARLKWRGVDVALECTGRFTRRDQAAVHLDNGSQRVLVSAPTSGADRTIVVGVNHRQLATEDTVISNASCTTNCLAPVAMVLDREIGIETGYMTTIHSFTGDQPVLDTAHKDPYRARGAGLSMIPSSTGAARAVGLVLPHLDGRLDGSAIRVPTPNVSVVDLSFSARRTTSVDEVNRVLGSASAHELDGILSVSNKPLVSVDFNHNPHSSIVAIQETRVMQGSFVRVLCWYDNEWGFSNRMLDNAVCIAGLDRLESGIAA